MNDFVSCAHGSRCYEQVRVMDEMNDSKLLGQGYRFYEQLYTVVEMNDYGGHELRALNAMTNVGLWLI